MCIPLYTSVVLLLFSTCGPFETSTWDSETVTLWWFMSWPLETPRDYVTLSPCPGACTWAVMVQIQVKVWKLCPC